MPRARAPIDFRRGASSRLTTDAGTFRTIRLLGFVPAGGPSRPRRVTSSPACRRSFLPWALPLSGLRSTPGFVPAKRIHEGRARRDSSSCARSRRGLVPAFRVISLRPADLPPAYPLVGVTASFPVERSRPATGVSAARDALALPAGTALRPGEIACPSACCGADAWSNRRTSRSAGSTPCLRFLHRP